MRVSRLLILLVTFSFLASSQETDAPTADEEEVLKVLSNRPENKARPIVHDPPVPRDDDEDNNNAGDWQRDAQGNALCEFQRQTKPHSSNPNMYFYRVFKHDEEDEKKCSWSRWRQKEFSVKPFPNAVRRAGRWYENARSNRFYLGYGKWRVQRTFPHPTNPTLEMVAGEWVLKPDAPKAFEGPDGKWYKSETSNTYYRKGKWIKKPVRQHPFNPTLWRVAGAWRRKPDSAMPGVANFSQRGGRWYRAGPAGPIPARFQYWKNGKWTLSRAYRKNKDDPRFKYNKVTGTFVRKNAMECRHYRQRRNRWYRSYWSPKYYKNMKWVKESPKWRDPTWRRNGKAWVRVPRKKTWVAVKGEHMRNKSHSKKAGPSGTIWYRDSSRKYYWWYGHWKRHRLTKYEKIAVDRERALEQLREAPAALDLDGIVNRASSAYYKVFLKWFLRRYLSTTGSRGLRKRPLYDLEPKTPKSFGVRSPYNVEPRPAGKRHMGPFLIPDDLNY